MLGLGKMIIMKTYKVKNYLTHFRKDLNKFSPEISELTTL